MDLGFFVRGLILGFSIAAPVGPIGVLCIRRTLAEGRLYGLVSGLGAASADAVYGMVAAFGLTFISDALTQYQNALRLVGGAFLLYLGVKTFLAEPAQEAAQVRSGRRGLLGAYVSIFFLTITNPMTILFFAATFTGLGLVNASGSDYLAAALTVLGVFSGSALWWLLLSGGVSLFRARFNARALTWVNRLSGAIIVAFAVVLLWSLIAGGG